MRGSTTNQASAPSTDREAATRKAEVQPKCEAIQGVREAVIIAPNWLPMFMKPETLPEEAPPMSAVTDQKELCER